MATHIFPPTNPARESEYWKPQRPTSFRVEYCEACGNELVIGSRYCHLCGVGRAASIAPSGRRSFEWRSLRQTTGLGNVSLGLAIVGLFCLAAALLTGVLHSNQSSADWAELQAARIEWLLGSIATLAAGILLKRC